MGVLVQRMRETSYSLLRDIPLLVRLKIFDVVPGGCWLILVSPQIGLRGSLEAHLRLKKTP
jgi:hypothetical protein